MAAVVAPNPPNHFLERVWQLPIVHAAYDYTSVRYQTVRDYYPVVKTLMTTAENSIYYAAEQSKPVMEKLNKPIQVADGFACQTLDIVEHRVPIITKTPVQITDEAKQIYAKNVALIKTRSTELLANVKGYGEQRAQSFLQTTYGQKAALGLENLMDKAGWYIDNNVPVHEGAEYPKQPVSAVEAGLTTQKAILLTSKIQQLLLLHTHAQLSHLSRVLQAISNMRATARDRTAEVVQHVKNRASSGQERAVQVYNEFKSRTEREGTLEHRLIATAHHASSNVAAVLKGISDTVKLPAVMQTTVQKTRENIVQLQQALTNTKLAEIPSSLLTPLREQVANIQGFITSAMAPRAMQEEAASPAKPSPKKASPVKPSKVTSSPRKERISSAPRESQQQY